MRKEFLFEEQRVIQDEVHTQEELFDSMSSLQLKPPFIVKPNWIYADYGHYTESEEDFLSHTGTRKVLDDLKSNTSMSLKRYWTEEPWIEKS